MISGELIKEARTKRGLSQEELGNMLNVTKVSICGYEKGTRTPTMETFVKIMKILDLTPDELLGRDIHAVCEEENYHILISKKELKIINILRNNPELSKKIYKVIEKEL